MSSVFHISIEFDDQPTYVGSIAFADVESAQATAQDMLRDHVNSGAPVTWSEDTDPMSRHVASVGQIHGYTPIIKIRELYLVGVLADLI